MRALTAYEALEKSQGPQEIVWFLRKCRLNAAGSLVTVVVGLQTVDMIVLRNPQDC
jgi:hypothetical protein